MADDPFDDDLIARTKAARKGSHGRGWEVEDLADELGVLADTYRKYESRSPLPHKLLLRFARLTGIPLEELLGGKPKAQKTVPIAPLEAVQEKPQPKRKPRQKAS